MDPPSSSANSGLTSPRRPPPGGSREPSRGPSPRPKGAPGWLLGLQARGPGPGSSPLEGEESEEAEALASWTRVWIPARPSLWARC